MKSLLEQVSGLEHIIRQLHKIDSKLQSGQFIQAYRENRRVIAELDQNKNALIKHGTKLEKNNE